MKVIVAGHQKTGTKTLNEAFTVLGYTVYDFLENFVYYQKQWQKIANGDGNVEDFKKMYANIDVVCDMPCLLYWEEIHKAFPDSKIILTVRDEESWYKSLVGQVTAVNANYFLQFIMLLSPSGWKVVSLGVKFARYAYGPIGPLWNMRMSEMNSKLSFRRHNAHVMLNAPKDKLLVYNVRDGWEPLCKFLGVDVPDVPFPHKNKGASIYDDLLKSHDILQRMKKEALVTLSVLVFAGAGATFVALKWFSVI